MPDREPEPHDLKRPSHDDDERFVIVVARKPQALRSGGKAKYQEFLREIAKSTFLRPRFVGSLYARILWFHREKPNGTDGDADNISKPILDALTDIVYVDDLQVIKRLVHKVYISEDFDLQGGKARPNDLLKLVRLLDGDEPHIIYMEIGPVRSQHVAFGPIEEVHP